MRLPRFGGPAGSSPQHPAPKRPVRGTFQAQCPRIAEKQLPTLPTFVVLGFAFLIRFLLLFPKRRAFLDKPAATKIIYGPAVLVALYFLYLGFVQPEFTGGMRTLTGLVVGIFIVGYFGWSLVTVIQSFMRATPEERSSEGVSLMLIGTQVALLPVTISNLVSTLAPSVTLPGFQYYGLLLGLIPITFALAAVKKGSA